MRPPTIYDVAEAAGVSPSTVSRAFSRPGRVSAETAAHIHQIAAKLGYRANSLSVASTASKSSTVAIVVPDVTNPVYFGVIRGFEAAATSAGYTMLLADTQWSETQERTVLDRVLPSVDGLVLVGSRLSDRSIRAAASHKPTVMINRVVPGTRTVMFDTAAGVNAALRHLAELGHRSITYVAGPAASWADGMRWRSVLDIAPELGLKVCRIGPYPPTMAGGAAVSEAVLRQPPTSILVFNDLLAIGLLRGLNEAGVRVPEEMSIVGFGNVFGSDFCSPPLTTIAAPMRAMGTAAFHQLKRAMRGEPITTHQVVSLTARLVVRRSTGAARRRRVMPISAAVRLAGAGNRAAAPMAAGSS
ncbi:LacI family DNA-binding transcriptional regulator [Nocardia goodfellowii]